MKIKNLSWEEKQSLTAKGESEKETTDYGLIIENICILSCESINHTELLSIFIWRLMHCMMEPPTPIWFTINLSDKYFMSEVIEKTV